MTSCSRLAAALGVCVVLAACGKSASESKNSTQVAAMVNGQEITVHQINQGLGGASATTPEQAAAARRNVLEQLVDQQLLVQKALDAKLDRNPDVLAMLESARRQVLAQAYMETMVMAAAAKPSDDEIRTFYDSRPDLFAARRIFRLQELAATVAPDKLPALLSLVEKTRNLNDVVAYLRANDIKFSADAALRPAEQIALDVLPVLVRMKDGDIVAMQANGRISILQRVSAAPMPLSVQEATPLIGQFLGNLKRDAAATAEMKKMRQGAKLAYMGEFAAAVPSSAPAGAQAAHSEARSAGPGSTGPGAAPNAERAGGTLQGAMEKGVRGLK